MFATSFVVSTAVLGLVGCVFMRHAMHCGIEHDTVDADDVEVQQADTVHELARETFDDEGQDVVDAFESESTSSRKEEGTTSRVTKAWLQTQPLADPLASMHLLSLAMQVGVGSGCSLVSIPCFSCAPLSQTGPRALLNVCGCPLRSQILMPFLLEIKYKMSSAALAGVMTTATLLAVFSATMTGKLLGSMPFYETSRQSARLLGVTGILTVSMFAVDNQW